MDEKTLWTTIIGFLANLALLITQFVEVIKLKKEMKDVKIIVNSTSELKKSLNKPFEGVWNVRGKYLKYHGVEKPHICTGYANFVWNDLQKHYEIYYVYSVQMEWDNCDVVTAICKGQSICNEDGNLDKKGKLTLELDIINRSCSDGINNQLKRFTFCSELVEKNTTGYWKIRFPFKNDNADGYVEFTR